MEQYIEDERWEDLLDEIKDHPDVEYDDALQSGIVIKGLMVMIDDEDDFIRIHTTLLRVFNEQGFNAMMNTVTVFILAIVLFDRIWALRLEKEDRKRQRSRCLKSKFWTYDSIPDLGAYRNTLRRIEDAFQYVYAESILNSIEASLNEYMEEIDHE